jgi:DNA-directed RNA polymerase specialized sigma24 family protein
MADESSFVDIMSRLRQRDNAAAAEVFRRFSHRLVALARTHLEARVRRKVDAEDVIQSVLKSFFIRYQEGQFHLDDWNNLWSMLVVITLRKCGHQVAHYRAACRSVERETVPLAASDEAVHDWEAVARDPTPSQAALLAEAVTELMTDLNDALERQILEMALQGFVTADISSRVGRGERTVQRVLQRVRNKLERMRDGS